MRYFIPLMLLALSMNLSADETISESLPPGHRARPYIERAEIEQQRMQTEKENSETVTSPNAAKSMAKFQAPIIVNTTHNGAFHDLLMMEPLADWLEIDDGSRWFINPNQRRLTYNWDVFDRLVITPNHAWFSSFEFCATNLNKNQTVEIKIKGRPIPNEVHSHWIIGLDTIRQEICLEDGSVWKLDGWDNTTYKNWAAKDFIIIGVNDSVWSKSTYPNILINVETYDYVTARCIH